MGHFYAFSAALLVSAAALAGCGSGDSVDRGEVEQKVLDGVEQQTGEKMKSVECDEDLPAEVGASIRCILTAPDGTRAGVTVTTRTVEGDTADFHFQVDDQPME